MEPTDELLRSVRSVEESLAALLALEIADRTADNPRRKKVGLDQILVGAGLPTARVASLLGKTQRAVQMAVADSGKEAP
jgi:hypothetical protein